MDRDRQQRPLPRCRLTRAAAYRHALAAGLDRAFLVAAGLAVLILVTAVVAIRGRAARGAVPSARVGDVLD
jgi:hypothetical protein